MKINFIMLVSLFFVHCFDGKREHPAQINLFIQEQEEKSLIGTWQMCKKIVDNFEISYNICPEFYFSEKGLGKVIKPSKAEIEFNYILAANNKVRFTSCSDKFDFNKKEYFYKIYTDKNTKVLEFISSENDKYILYQLSKE